MSTSLGIPWRGFWILLNGEITLSKLINLDVLGLNVVGEVDMVSLNPLLVIARLLWGALFAFGRHC